MSDSILHVAQSFFAPDASDFDLKLHDNSDGTMSLVAYVASAAVNGGAASIGTGNPTAGAASAAVVAARATRRSVLIRNEHATDSCRVGPGTVSSTAGFLLKTGEAVTINTVAVINAIRTGSADVPLSYLEEYD